MGSPKHSHRAQAQGFTLLELLVVLLLVGLLSAFVLPRVGGSLPGLQLRTAARKVSATFRYAAQRAMTEQLVYTVRFDEEVGTVVLAAETGSDRIPSDTASPAEKPPGSLNQWQLPEDIRFVLPLDRGARAAEETYMVFFYPGGGGSGGAVRLAGSGDRQLEVQVDFITSQVSIRDADEV